MSAPDVLARALAWARGTASDGQARAESAPAARVAPVTPAAPVAASTGPAPATLAVSVAAALCRRFEGLYLRPYLCPAGVPTIGYGSTRYLDGTPVRLTDPAISRDMAERMLLQSIQREYLPAVLRLCPHIDTPERLAAIIDWTYNLGAGQLAASTLRKRINAGRWPEVPTEIRRWNRGGGRVLRGLEMRREAEVLLV